MLQRFDKCWPYVLMLTLSYLTYTAMNQAKPGFAGSKAMRGISESMLRPKLIEPEAHASPADRDPFEVDWASYLSRPEDVGPTTQTASAPSAPSAPPEPSLPPLTGRLLAVFHRQDLRLAVIGEQVYKVGSTIGGDDPDKCWQVVAIKNDSVVVKFGKAQRVLRIARPPPPADVPAADGR